ncbi:hypothetical protein ES705_03327 [subsurface metagenome]
MQKKSPRNKYDYNLYNSQSKQESKNTYQAHCIIGNQAYSNKDDKRFVMHLLNNLLGGPGMNSRLNMILREKKGLAYNVESNYSTYTDVGIFHIYFGTDKKDLNQCLNLIHSDLKKLRGSKLGTIQLSRAQRQLIGQIAIAAENNENLMLSNGRSILLFDRIDSLKEITKKIETISSKDIQEISNDILIPHQLSSLMYC